VLVLSKPPYLRWAVAVLLIGAAVAWDLSSRATEPAPFASVMIPRGGSISPDTIEWRQVPVGLLHPVNLDEARAAVRIDSGDPITQGAVSSTPPVPEGWWTIAMDLPPAALPGSSVRIVLANGVGVTGVVVEPSGGDSFGVRTPGLVAVPGELSDAVGLAAGAGQLVVLFEP
jgi:hypothetical protein